VLRDLPPSRDPSLLVGLETGDDAGVYRLSDTMALVQTVDFFTPIVDDPYLYGQIAAANALSDVYAMGGQPLTAMNILCYPMDLISDEDVGSILRGGADKVAEAGVALVGGHSVDDREPKYGLSVTGLIHPDHIASNAGAQPGDLIVLTKALGTGIIVSAARADSCEAGILATACENMAALNSGAAEAMREVGIGRDSAVHAATDITGFSLLGHLLHLARASGVAIELESDAAPVLPGAESLVAAGFITRGGENNLAHVEPFLSRGLGVSELRLAVLTDPQTSGGLAICVAPGAAARLIEALERRSVPVRAVIGRVVAGAATITVR
jgi:selenide,water dikinase